MDDVFSGLVLHGEVTNRHLKKNVGEQNKEYVTYTITSNDGKDYYVIEWEPDKEKCYKKGEHVDICVYIKPYIKNGIAKFSYNIGKETRDFLGEEF